MINWISVEDRLPSVKDHPYGANYLCFVHVKYKNCVGETVRANVYDWYDEPDEITDGGWRENWGSDVTHWIYAKDLPFPD